MSEINSFRLRWPIEDVIGYARRYAMTHGLLCLVPNNLDQAMIVPFSLYPSPYSFEHFQSIWSIQTAYNRLYQKISLDDAALEKALSPVLPLDDFVARLWTIHRRIPCHQPIQLDIYRSKLMIFLENLFVNNFFSDDYMLDTKVNQMRQIEFNTISSAFAGLTAVVGQLHQAVLRYALDRCSIHHLKIDEKYQSNSSSSSIDFLFPNEALKKSAEAMCKAFDLYGNHEACLLFLVTPQERNICDQNALISAIHQQCPSLPIYLKTFQQLTLELIYDEKTSKIFLKSTNEEIALVYFRAGYIPDHYIDESCWNVREIIEKSLAIKCPTIRSQLAGCKIVQEYLTRPGIVEKYVAEMEFVTKIRSTFAQMFTFDDQNMREHYRNILRENPHHYVLKPQREGGGNNKYDEELLNIIENQQEILNNFIGMEKIFPSTCRSSLIKSSGENLLNVECINEIGIYGTMLSNTTTNEQYLNEVTGYLVRTKTIGTNEGGVATGYSVLDCLNFADNGHVLANIFVPKSF